MEIKKLKVSELKPHPKNTLYFRDMIGLEWQNFLDDISEVGVKNPIIINQNNYVVSGNQRLKACIELGIDTIDCIVRSYESEEQEISDLIRFNVIQRNLTLFDTLELINKVKQGYKSRQGNNQYTCLASADNRQKLTPPREQISKEFGISKDYITLANKWEQLTPDVQDALINRFKDKIPTQKAVSNEVNSLLRQKEYELQQLKKDNETKQLTIDNLENKSKNYINKLEQEKKEIKNKLDNLSIETNKKTNELAELRGYKSQYNEIKAKENEINDTYRKIEELKEKQSDLFNDTESCYFLRQSFKNIKEFTSKNIVEVGATNITENSLKFMQPEFIEILSILENWTSFLREKFIIKD